MMSKPIRCCAVLLMLGCFANSAFSREHNVAIRLTENVGKPPTFTVSGTFGTGVAADERRGLQFLDTYADSVGLSQRINVLECFSGELPIACRSAGNGFFAADQPVDRWLFQLRSPLPLSGRTAGHVSWFDAGRAMVFLDDIVPQLRPNQGALVEFVLPSGWTVVSGERSSGDNQFDVRDVSRASFYLTKSARSVATSGRSVPSIAIDGRWRFDDATVGKFASEVAAELEIIFGEPPPARSSLVISSFPVEQAFGVWEADARGRTIVILSADMPFETQSQQLLHEQLRHEIFHQWIPNGVGLVGDYAWFYEGFALYQSLKIGVRIGRIRFSDMLDTISNAERIAKYSTRTAIRRSRNSSEIYARGMLAAFYTDVLLLNGSGGRRSVETFLRRFYQKARNSSGSDAERLIIDQLTGEKDLGKLVDSVVLGRSEIDRTAIYARSGLSIDDRSGAVRVSIIDRPNRAQRAMLKRLGYNG